MDSNVDRSERIETHAAAVLRIAAAVDDYLYTNEHCADGSRRSVFSGPNRERLMGGAPPAGSDAAVEWEKMIHADDWAEHLAHRERLRRGEASDVRYRLVGYDGVTRWIHARTQPAHVDGRIFVDGIVSDVTRQIEAERQLALARESLEILAAANEHQALHDSLTGLGNRRKLMDALECSFSSDESWLLALFDLDGFKSYNDTFGHPAGDALLVRLASRLRDAMPSEATFRLGGDEFVVLAPDATDLGELLSLASAALCEEGEGFSIAASFGAAFLPADADHAESALQLCDQRLYNEKQNRQERRGRPQDVLLEVLSAREAALEDHSESVAALSVAVAELLGLLPHQVETLRQAALLHDIGKIGMPDSVLRKPGPLDEDEWSLMRRHTVIGERILASSPALVDIALIVRSTHENVDGSGYPDGLSGTEIGIEARIISACDAYSAMTSDRPYRPARSRSDALFELDRCAGTQFDPAVACALREVVTRSDRAGAAGGEPLLFSRRRAGSGPPASARQA